VVPDADPIPQAVADAVKKAQGEPGLSAKVPLPPPAAPTGRQVSAKPPEGFLPPPRGDPGELVPGAPLLAPPPAAVLLNPVPSQAEAASDSADAFERARRSDKRFKDLVLDVKGGVVKISGSAARTKDAMDLAEKVNALPGVRQVILGNVEEK
jgi:hypothetical protein